MCAALNKLLQYSLNHCARYDETLQQTLIALNGRSVSLNITDLHWSCYIMILRGEFIIQSEEPDTVDCRIQGSLNDFINLSDISLMQRKNASNTLRIEGDVDVGTQLKKCLAECNIDWYSMTNDQFGETTTSLLYHLAKHTHRAGKHFFTHTCENIYDFRHETALAPTKEDYRQFEDAVYNLQQRLDICEQRIQRHQLLAAGSP